MSYFSVFYDVLKCYLFNYRRLSRTIWGYIIGVVYSYGCFSDSHSALQSGKSAGLSGAIVGGAETFPGRTREDVGCDTNRHTYCGYHFL